MISIETKLSGNIEAGLEQFGAKIADSVLFSGAAAMARVLYDEVKLNASPPRMGRKTGNLERSIYRVYSPEKSGDAFKTYRISWNRSKAPHGHLVEFGTSRSPARPFVRPAFDKVQEAIKAGTEAMTARLAGGVASIT
jgi:HK97 gp10 family phage protein